MGSGGLLGIFSPIEDLVEHHADRRTDNLFLLNSFKFQFVVSCIYLVTVMYALPKYMQYRKAYRLKTTIRLYNVLQILACLYIIIGSLSNKWSLHRALFSMCYPVNTDPTDAAATKEVHLFYFTYLVKLSEFLETVFFALRKKNNQISGLHLYHHVSTLYICWWGARFTPGGLALLPIFINCVVHVIMYAYYLITNLGPKWQKRVQPVKPYITIIQMVQFTILIFLSFVLLSPYYCKQGPQTLGYIFLPNVILNFFLFYRFFKQSYSSKPGARTTTTVTAASSSSHNKNIAHNNKINKNAKIK